MWKAKLTDNAKTVVMILTTAASLGYSEYLMRSGDDKACFFGVFGRWWEMSFGYLAEVLNRRVFENRASMRAKNVASLAATAVLCTTVLTTPSTFDLANLISDAPVDDMALIDLRNSSSNFSRVSSTISECFKRLEEDLFSVETPSYHWTDASSVDSASEFTGLMSEEEEESIASKTGPSAPDCTTQNASPSSCLIDVDDLGVLSDMILRDLSCSTCLGEGPVSEAPMPVRSIPKRTRNRS